MATKHNNLKRIVRRSLEELRATFEIAKVTSVRGAAHTFFAKALIQVLNRVNTKEGVLIRRCLRCKHEVMREYVEKVFASFLQQYEFSCVLPKTERELKKTVWICWWQGAEHAPEITQKCIASVKKNVGDCQVVVITEENYNDYVQFPEWIEEKYQKGIISRTHYSDILRLFLLAEYGGLWLDASILCTGPEIKNFLDTPLWTIKRPDYGHLSVSGGRFVTGAMGCDEDHRWIFATIRDFLLEYWKRHDLLIDYLIFDYLIDLVMRKNSQIEECFDGIESNNPRGDDLLKIMGDPFDADNWENMKKETALFVLSWKREFPEKKEGKATYYAKLLEEEL